MFCRIFSGMAKDITYYFKCQSRCEFDLSKIPPSISHATIKTVQNEVNGKRGVYLKLSGKEKALVGSTLIITEWLLQYNISTALDSLLI